MSKLYLVMAPFWASNGEYRYTAGGSPVAAFTSREAADERCEAREINAWRFNMYGESIGEWIQGSYKNMGTLPEDEATAMLKAAFPNEDGEDYEIDLDNFVFPTEVTDEQIKVLREVFCWIYFNHVVKVDLEQMTELEKQIRTYLKCRIEEYQALRKASELSTHEQDLFTARTEALLGVQKTFFPEE